MSPFRKGRTINWRITAVAVHDLVMAAVTFELAVWIRYFFEPIDMPFLGMWEATVVFTAISGLVFSRIGLYRAIWHYASFNDLVAILKAVSLAILIFLAVLFMLTRLQDLPRSVLLLEWPLLIFALSGPRLLYRAYKDGDLSKVFDRSSVPRVPVLLAGAGHGSEAFIREMRRNRVAGYRVVGIIDDKRKRIGRDIQGVRVLGDLASLPDVVARLDARGDRPQRLVITNEKIDGATVRTLFDAAEGLGLTLGRMPKLTEIRGGAEPRIEIRPVEVADLLGRPQKVLDRPAMAELIAGKRVLVTGAGGTIGSELVRQIATFEPAHLTLLENSEYSLYQIDLELMEQHPDLARNAVLGDVRDGERLANVFARARPQLVFHAAAFKHVPLVEANPCEAVLTNTIGTRRLADACRRGGVEAMVMISTDKAVNPSSVMGASKRMAEIYCQAAAVEGAAGGGCRFVTVRFGNVLGSTGSVVPLFQRQLAAGGPLTVTHPDVIRYFMTTREAVELVLQASTLEHGPDGRIFVLDMGEPVRIQDLARQMIRLAGLRPDHDVTIEYVGLRPGEKLFEELFHDREQLVPTNRDGILLAAPRLIDMAQLAPLMERLETAARNRDLTTVMALITELVPEFQGNLDQETQAAANR